jgi:hypothetical protein
MRFMAMVKATKDSEAGKMPSEELLSAMAKFNEEMVKAGVMLDGNGLQPSSKGARVRFSGAKRTVIDGPFAETKELIAGYWILEVKSKAEAIEWIKRCPNPHEGESEIEIRQIFELEDFGDSEAVAHHRRLGELVDSARFCCGSVDISNANARAVPREGVLGRVLNRVVSSGWSMSASCQKRTFVTTPISARPIRRTQQENL